MGTGFLIPIHEGMKEKLKCKEESIIRSTWTEHSESPTFFVIAQSVPSK